MSINNKAKRAKKKKIKESQRKKSLTNFNNKSKNPAKIEFICPICKTSE